MQLVSKEHYDLMANFEKRYKAPQAKEDKALWAKGYIYCNGEVNSTFLAFREGYALAKALCQ